MNDVLYVVIPCYNEEEVLTETSHRLKEKMESLIQNRIISNKSRIVFVNDGSRDRTWEMIKQFHENDIIFSGINLSRNRGHQNALLAGLMTTRDYADVVISMDADLQDDINIIDEMLEKYRQGYEIVYGVRSKRETDTVFKRLSALGFYKFMNLMGAEIVYNHADYRLMSRRSLEGLAQFNEVNLFLRGIIPMIGYNSTCVYYERSERFAGESKYPLSKMIFFAMQGITSLSVKPMRCITLVGLIASIFSLLIAIWSIIQFIFGHTVPGWTSMFFSIWFLGGMILMSIGIVGEYIGKIYLETKHRPRFIIEDFINDA